MRCGGCGAKVGAGVLSRALARLPAALEGAGVLVGLDAPDDAALIAPPPGLALVQSLDFFRSFIGDPFVFGEIAANHALGDLFAMGAEPHSALALAVVPYAAEAKIEDDLFQLLAGARRTLDAAGAALIGGHSGEGAELALGFAAAMRLAAKGRWIAAALDAMRQSQRQAALLLQAHGVRACTDVTGFGLIGHLAEMIRAGHAGTAVAVELDVQAVPALEGALQLLAGNFASSLQRDNLRARHLIGNMAAASGDPRLALLFDPQTAGGLLAGVPADRATACLAALQSAGYAAAIIGTVVPRAAGQQPIRLASAS